MHINWSQVLPDLWLPAVEILAGLFLGPLVKKSILRMARKAPDKGVLTFLASLSGVAIMAIAFLMALEQLGIRMSGTLGLISAVGLGMTLALKDNMSNVAGGIQILLTRPFVVGDYIRVGRHRGTVSSIELMYTTLRTDNSKEVIIPNSVLVQDLITNWSREEEMQMTIHFHVKLPCDVPAALEEARILAAGCPYLAADAQPETWCSDIRQGHLSLSVGIPVKGQDSQAARRWLLTEIASRHSCCQAKKHTSHQAAASEEKQPARGADNETHG